MKKILLTAAILVATATASAQISAFRQGNSVSVEGYSLPRTVISVKVTQEREVIIKGPYARYASQYLGIVGAPMSDKESYKIIDAQIGFFEEPDPKQVFVFDEKSGNPVKVFNWLSLAEPQAQSSAIVTNDVDFVVPFKDLNANVSGTKTSVAEKSADQMASEAADVIFRIRKKRVELITGEIGEGAFGEGLKAALEEMSRVEAEYLSLFIGKRYTQVITKTICVAPEMGKNRIPAFRFSDNKGIVPDTDLSGRPVNLELTAENIAARLAEPSNKKAMKTVIYRIPQMTIVKLTDGQTVLSSQRVPVYQAGGTVEAPIVFGL